MREVGDSEAEHSGMEPVWGRVQASAGPTLKSRHGISAFFPHMKGWVIDSCPSIPLVTVAFVGALKAKYTLRCSDL